jgi:hypothetical protein
VWRVSDLHLNLHIKGQMNASFPGIAEWLAWEGHAGEDYGTISRHGYHPKLGLSFTMMVNREVGTFPVGSPTFSDMHLPFCVIWRLLFQLLDVGAEVPDVDDAFHCAFDPSEAGGHS